MTKQKTSYLLEILLDSSLTKEDRVNQINWALLGKGFGDRNQELQFASEVLKEIFAIFPQLESFEWSQYQDFNDNYLYYDLSSFFVNGKYSYSFPYLISFFESDKYSKEDDDYEWGNLWPLNQEMSFEKWDTTLNKNPNLSSNEKLDEYDIYLVQQYKHLQEPCDTIGIFLTALWKRYGPYYFIYLFGRRAKIKITRKGIKVTTNDIEFLNGDNNDNDFYPDLNC